MDVAEIRKILGSALSGAEVSTMEFGVLEDAPALAILAEWFGGTLTKRSPFGPGLASAQIMVHDCGDHTEIQLVALATTIAQSFAGARNAKASGQGMVGG